MRATPLHKASMLSNLSAIIGSEVRTPSEPVGRVRDVLLDDVHWAVRYLVVDTGKWLARDEVLVSPYQTGEPDLGLIRGEVPLRMNREQLESAPPLDSDAPISRQYEHELARFYAYPIYWEGNDMWGANPYPEMQSPPTPEAVEHHRDRESDIEKSHLRSVCEILGYRLHARDGEIGHVEDFLANNRSWAVRYMIVDTRNWLPGRKVLVAPAWIESVDWHSRLVAVGLKREAVKESPVYHPGTPIDRKYEAALHEHYDFPKPW